MFVARQKKLISVNGFLFSNGILFTRCENLPFNASHVLFRAKKKSLFQKLFGGICQTAHGNILICDGERENRLQVRARTHTYTRKFPHSSHSEADAAQFRIQESNDMSQLASLVENWEIHKYLLIEVIHFGVSKLNANYKICINGWCGLARYQRKCNRSAIQMSKCGVLYGLMLEKTERCHILLGTHTHIQKVYSSHISTDCSISFFVDDILMMTELSMDLTKKHHMHTVVFIVF